mmetsp:Transcript_40641/g.91685  ORF Transcript_40641/g.91685 Transcript_40641/m.91685 type:complete len:223 (-) Transcript_40641:474-1142(-)
MASWTAISARFSSDSRRRRRSSFSPFCFSFSCRIFDSSCSFMTSRSAAFFCASSCATRCWWSLELWSSFLLCSSPRSSIVFCSSSHRTFSMLRFTRATSTSASAAFRFSTRSRRASRSTAARNSALKSSMSASCASVLLLTSSRLCLRATCLSSCCDRNWFMSCSRRTKPSSVFTRAICRTSTLATVRMIWSSMSSRFLRLSFCSSTTATISFCSLSIALSQ